MRLLETIWTALLLIKAARAQTSSSNGAFTRYVLCNETFNDANATGIFTAQPNVDQGSQSGQPDNNSRKTLPIDLAYTLTQYDNGSRLDASYWLNPRGANFSDDFQLGYDICGMALTEVTNQVRYQGSTDNGSCSEAFSLQCIGAIKAQAAQYALDLTRYPTPLPNSNLTATSIGTVCDGIRDRLQENFPQECAQYFNGSAKAYLSTALTGYNSSIIYSSSCNTNASYNDSYHRILNQFVDYSDEVYAQLSRTIIPIVAVWMPIANAERPSSIDYAHAEMVCTLITNFNPGSEIPAALSDPSQRDGTGELSKGAIAGIVIASIAGVGIAVSIAWYLIRRKRKRRSELISTATTAAATSQDEEFHDQTEKVAVEMLVEDHQHELDSGNQFRIFHMPQRSMSYELEGRGVPQVER